MNRKDFQIACFLGIATFFFYALFTNMLPVTEPVETNYTLTAKEMLANKSWISPIIFGNYWFDKPPLTYWRLMLSYKIFGFTDFASRLPATITAACSSVAMYLGMRVLEYRKKIAFWASMIMITSFEFWYISHAVITDGYLFLSLLGIFVASYKAFTTENAKWMIFAYGAAGVAVLAKGPVGLLLPGTALFLFVLLQKKASLWKLLFHPLGLLTFCVIALPWYIAMYFYHDMDFVEGFLGLHNYLRATVSEHPSQNYWFYYVVLLPFSLLPWTGYTLSAWYEQWKTKSFRTNSLVQFQWIWALVILLFFSLVQTKYITYTFPALIPFFMMTAVEVVRREYVIPSRMMQWGIALFPAVIFSVILMGAAYWEVHINPSLMLFIGSVCLLGAVFSFFKSAPKHYNRSTFVIALLLFLALPVTIMPLLNVRSAKVYGPVVAELRPDDIYFYYGYDTSFTYYTGLVPLRVIDTDLYHLDVWDLGKDVMPSMSLKDFEKERKLPNRAIFLVDNKAVANFEMSKTSQSFHPIGKFDNTIIYANYEPAHPLGEISYTPLSDVYKQVHP